MRVFVLIVRIVLLLGFLAGIILIMIAPTIAKTKKFKNEQHFNHYMVKLKLIGFVVCASAVALLLIVNMIVN